MSTIEVLECRNNSDELNPCEGEIEYHPALPVRWHRSGAMVQFVRCAKHYNEYCDRHDEREAREARYQASLYCKHGTYVGDAYGADYLCGACESE